MVDTGAAVARIPNHPRLRGERSLANDLDEELFVASKREAGRGMTPASRPGGSLIVLPASTAVETVRIAARAQTAPTGVVNSTPRPSSSMDWTGVDRRKSIG